MTTQVFELHTSPAAHWVSSTQATQTPGLPLLPGLQCGAAVLEAQSFSVVQVVALTCRQTFWTGSQTCPAGQSEFCRQATQAPSGLQCGVGLAQSLSVAQAPTQWCEASQVGAEMLGQSPESRHSTQARCCRSQTGVGLTQSRFEAQPGSATQTSSVHSLPGPQSRGSRQATQAPLLRSQTGVCGWAEQSASRAQLPDSPGTQQPLAQCWPAPQTPSSLQAAEPMQKPLLAQRPATHFCGDGQSLLSPHGRSPRPWEQPRTSAMSSRRRTILDFIARPASTAHRLRYDNWRSRSRR